MVEPEERMDFEEHNSAELIHDEVGFDLRSDIEPEDDYSLDGRFGRTKFAFRIGNTPN